MKFELKLTATEQHYYAIIRLLLNNIGSLGVGASKKIYYHSVVCGMSAFVPVVRVGCGCLVQSSLHPGRVLLGRRLGSHGAGKFALPGGHLELGESWADCLRREVKEETNLDVDNFQLVHVTVN